MGKIGEPSTCSALCEALQDESDRVQWDVGYALDRMGDARGLPVLFEIFRCEERRKIVFEAPCDGMPEETNRRVTQIGFTLWKLGPPVVSAVLAALKDANHTVRSAAAGVLRQLGSPHTLPRKIIADRSLSPLEQIAMLDGLRQVNRGDVRFDFQETGLLCCIVLTEPDPGAREGAQAILEWMNLLRAAHNTSAVSARELVRPSPNQGLQVEPHLMLRVADPSAEGETGTPARRTIWRRLFSR